MCGKISKHSLLHIIELRARCKIFVGVVVKHFVAILSFVSFVYGQEFSISNSTAKAKQSYNKILR